MNTDDGSLQLYLKLDEVQDGKVRDDSVNGIEPTIHGDPQVTDADWIERSLKFDGEDDYLEIPNSDAINFATDQDFTVEAWVKVASEQKFQKYNDNDIIEKWSQLSARYPYVIRYLRGANKIMAARYDGSNNPSVITKSKLNSNQFYHVAFVKDGQNLYLYLNGKREGSAVDTTQNDTKNSSPLYLARRGNKKYANFFAGELAHVRIYSQALSQPEIKRDMVLSITPDLAEELKELRSFKATWEQVKQGIGDVNSAERQDIPEDIKEILGILGQADITRQILLISATADGDRNQADEATAEALQFAKQAQESAQQASRLSPDSLENAKAQNAARRADNAAKQAQRELARAEAAARSIKDLINLIVTPSSDTPDGIDDPSLEPPVEENPASEEPAALETEQALGGDREALQQQAQEYAATAQNAREEALRLRNLAREQAAAAAQYAKEAGEYYDNWETIGDIFGFSESNNDGDSSDNDNVLGLVSFEDAPAEHDNWQVVGNLFGLPAKQENSEAANKQS
ncbi:MAG: LamG domain-containing protein [Cyanobacteria bacterium J06621_8]